MSPYRSVEPEARAEAPRDPGIVGEIIAQFADPLAFYRELVQNAIDAGTAAVEVRLEHDAAASVLRASVRDRGEGMTREVLEKQLLVLFRSTKERDATKIGKFGIGFASVLAPRPTVVTVQSVRAGRRLTVQLYPDLTYQIFDGGAATQPGTVVELELPMDAERAVAFAKDSRAALVRWCRHAAVPIQFDAVVGGRAVSQQIDRPLAIEGALVEVRGEADGGALVVVAAIVPASAAPYTGFFNHGLTLYETREPILDERVAIKIQDALLGHTLSRDNVRRDNRFERVVRFARELVRERLVDAAARALREAAGAADRARYEELAGAIVASGVAISPAAWSLPLVEPLDGERWISLAAAGGKRWWTTRPSPITAALAREGTPVIQASSAPAVARIRALGCELVEVSQELTLVTIVEPARAGYALLAVLGELLDAAHRAPLEIAIGELTGSDDLAVTLGERNGDTEIVVSRDDAKRSPFTLLRRRALVLSRTHPVVAAALGSDDPVLAASHLARALLLHYRLLDVARSTVILERTLARLGVA